MTKTRITVATPPMEAKSVEALPNGREWQFEPKWDGFRCLAFKNGNRVDLQAKSGKPLGRYFPEVVKALLGLNADHFVIDGELIIEIGGILSFDALQMRLHPAQSRITKLSNDTPAHLIVFDMLVDTGGQPIIERPLSERRRKLEGFIDSIGRSKMLKLSPATRSRSKAETWLGGHDGTDGVVAKRIDSPYIPGERAMLKVKRLRTADCVVGGFRYKADSKLVGSLLLGLYGEDGRLNHVGFSATISNADRPALTRRLKALREPPGFTGDAPGGPSRWSTERSTQWEPLRPELVVEVRYDHVSGGRFRHGTKLIRWRPDKAPRQCTCEQITSP